MPISFYMDHHVPRAITLGLRLRKVDVTTAFEDGASELDDQGLLDRASELRRVLFTHDDDLLVAGDQTAKRRRVISRHRVRSPTSSFDRHLCGGPGTHCRVGEPMDLLNQVIFLPL